MDNNVIKNALSYALGADLHEAWNISHGTDEVDIANCSFEELPSNWQYENLEAARVAIEMVFEKTMSGELITKEEEELMASTIHDEWLKRNDWVFDSNYGDPSLAVPFNKLSKEEQDKDKAQLLPAQQKVKDYMSGKINIEFICLQYGLSTTSKTK